MNTSILKEYVDLLARRLREDEGTEEAHFVADQLERVGQLLAFTGARNAAEYYSRIEANEDSVKEKEYRRGFDEGRIRGIEECQSVIRASYGHHN
jgi:hypothetical protein